MLKFPRKRRRKFVVWTRLYNVLIANPKRERTITMTCFSVYTGCGGNLTATDTVQQLASERYPGRYTNNRRCEYRISAPNPQQPVIITFDRFRTEGCCDCLYVYDGGYFTNFTNKVMIKTLVRHTTRSVQRVRVETLGSVSVNPVNHNLTWPRVWNWYWQVMEVTIVTIRFIQGWMEFFSARELMSVADPRGALPACTPLATKFFSISCSFGGKFNKFVSRRPHLKAGTPLSKSWIQHWMWSASDSGISSALKL